MSFGKRSNPRCLVRARGAWAMALSAVACLVALALPLDDAFAAQPSVGLGTANSFAVLAGSTVTNTGPSTVNGNLGLSPGTAVDGWPPGTVNGTIYAAEPVSGQAKSDLTIAYDDAAGRLPPATVSGDLGGSTLVAGVYKSASSLGLTGALTLDAQGDPNAVFVFQAGSTLTTASGSHVNLINGAQSCNVFWQIGSSATLGTRSVFTGSILALTSISMNEGVVVHGRALARNGAVTLINDTITAEQCAGGTTGGGTTGGGTPAGGGTPGAGTPGAGTPGAGTPGGGLPASSKPRITSTTSRCVAGTFKAVVRGHYISRVVFSVGKKPFATVRKSPFAAVLGPVTGSRTVTAKVSFADRTRAKTVHMRAKACAAAQRVVAAQPLPPPFQPPVRPPGFTG